MAEYRLLTIWHIEAPLQRVFDAIADSLRWPEWWPGADHVEELVAGEACGVGNVRRYVWKGRLPYRLCFDARTTRIEPASVLEASISGDLEGTGRWTFHHEDGVTTVYHEWQVRTTRHWMNLAASVARSVFANNHRLLMAQGARGLAEALDGRVVDAGQCKSSSAPRPASRLPGPVNWRAAAGAGIGAGIVATVVQMALWGAAGYPAWEMLLRDSRLAAAIVLGRNVLPPPADFNWRIMLFASLVHFALSAVYGFPLAALAARLRLLPCVLVCGLFGLMLYALNMYGFTALFPWFAASRDWITAAAHLSFGVAAALLYKLWHAHSR